MQPRRGGSADAQSQPAEGSIAAVFAACSPGAVRRPAAPPSPDRLVNDAAHRGCGNCPPAGRRPMRPSVPSRSSMEPPARCSVPSCRADPNSRQWAVLMATAGSFMAAYAQLLVAVVIELYPGRSRMATGAQLSSLSSVGSAGDVVGAGRRTARFRRRALASLPVIGSNGVSLLSGRRRCRPRPVGGGCTHTHRPEAGVNGHRGARRIAASRRGMRRGVVGSSCARRGRPARRVSLSLIGRRAREPSGHRSAMGGRVHSGGSRGAVAALSGGRPRPWTEAWGASFARESR